MHEGPGIYFSITIKELVAHCFLGRLNECFIIIIIVSIITVFAGVLFVYQPGANHAPRASVTQVNHSVHTLSTFLRIRADPSMQILLLLLLLLL